jgi:hypothetical protein
MRSFNAMCRTCRTFLYKQPVLINKITLKFIHSGLAPFFLRVRSSAETRAETDSYHRKELQPKITKTFLIYATLIFNLAAIN